MSKLGNVQKTRSGGQGTGWKKHNVVFQVTGYNIPGGKKPSDEDYIEATLIHDVGGRKAGDVVKIVYSDDPKGNSRRPTMPEYRDGRGNSAQMSPDAGALGIASRAYFDNRTGNLVCDWLERWYPEVTDEHFPLPNVVASVRPEVTYTRNGEERTVQNRYVMNTDAAVTFKGLDDFKEKAAALIDGMGDTPGTHSVVVRVIDLENPSSTSSISFNEGWDAEANARRGGAASVEYFLGTEEGANWQELIETSDDTILYEVIPQIKLMTGSMSLPSYRKADKERNTDKALTENQLFALDDSMRYRLPEDGSFTAAFAPSHVRVQRKGDGPWFATHTIPVETYPVLMLPGEVITPNVPEEVAEKLRAHVEARHDSIRQERTAAREDSNDAAPAPSAM